MRFKELSDEDKLFIKELYKDSTISKKSVQKEIAEKFNAGERTVRRWAKWLNLNVIRENIVNPDKILVYDIETSRVEAKVWWTGKTYINHKQLKSEPKIITVAWKWLSEEKVYSLTWDKNHCDKQLMKDFLEIYNDADMVVGQNNDKFDNRWLNARAMKYDLHVNTFVKSFDVMKQTKRLFRLPSYSMDYVTKFLGVTNKQGHEGLHMWDMIEDGNKEQQKEYLQKMIDYNVGDIISTEEMYLKLRKYMNHKMHFGVLSGGEKYSCPSCGSENVSLYKTTTTAIGTIQRIMICNDDKVQYKISNREYYRFIDNI